MSLSISSSKISTAKPTNNYIKSYLKKYLFLVFIALLFSSGFILIIDPLYIFRIVNIKGFNAQKPFYQDGGMRESKSIDLNSGKYDVVLFGTSRVNQGIDSSHPLFPHHLFPNQHIFNAGLNGAHFYETYKVFKFASEQNQLDTAIIDLGFEFFTNQQRVIDAFYESKFADKNQNMIIANFNDLFSYKMLERSWKTFAINRATKQVSLTSEKAKNNRIKGIFNSVKLLKPADDSLQYNSPDTISLVKQIIEEARAKNIKLYLLIAPVHARHLENKRLSDLYPVYEQWKRDLVKVVAEDARKHPEQNLIYLWDFEGYNSVTTEVPETNEPKDELTWFKDQTHQTRELGNWVMEVMFSYPNRPDYIPSDFGVLLTEDNIEQHLQKIRQDQAKYHLQYPEEIKKIERLAKKEKEKGQYVGDE